MNIQPYQDKYKTAVIALWKKSGISAPQNDPSKDIERKMKVDPDLFLIGLVGDTVVGSVMGGYEGHRGWINYLAVDPDHQRKGYGRALMQAVEVLIHAKGCPKINLQVRTTNESVIQFYAALGYGNDNVIGLGKRFDYD
jgi:ribosomal protein S18 acetylase RimI-like enzyme